MIVLPNTFERYLASLRNLTYFYILKYGLNAKYINHLKKINLAEAFFHKKTVQSVDIKNHCENLLFAVLAHNPDLKFYINTNCNHQVNQKLLSILIVNICRFSDFLKIDADGEFLYFNFWGNPKNISNITSALKGNSFYETKSETSLLVISAPETKEKAIPYQSEWEWLFDEFSIVNLFL